MNNPQAGRAIRWYEKNQSVRLMANRIEKLDPDFQQLIGKILCSLLDRMWDNYRYNSKLKEVGAERQIGLLKSQNRRRWYDREFHLRKAFTRMSLLDEKVLENIAELVNPALEHLEDYLEWCDERNKEPEEEFYLELIRLSLERGSEAGYEYLKKRTGVAKPVQTSSEDAHRKKQVKENVNDMKISAKSFF